MLEQTRIWMLSKSLYERINMPDKSLPVVEQYMCTVCGGSFDTGAVLFGKEVEETESKLGLCAPHEKLHDAGYVAFVSVDPDRCASADNIIEPEAAFRTGDIAHVKRSIVKQITNIPSTYLRHPALFIDDQLMLELKTAIANNNDDSAIN